MTFAYPKLIILLVIPVVFLFWEWVRHGRPLVMPFDDVRQRRGWLVGLPVLIARFQGYSSASSSFSVCRHARSETR